MTAQPKRSEENFKLHGRTVTRGESLINLCVGRIFSRQLSGVQISLLLVALSLCGCDIPVPSGVSVGPPASQQSSPTASPGDAGAFDIFEPIGEVQDGSIKIRCYGFARIESREVIIEQAKALAKTMKPGSEVAYIFNVKKGVENFIEARRTGAQFSTQLQKWMRDSHFAMISYMSQGNEGSRWELIQENKVAERKFNNKMEPIPLSETK